MFVHFFAMIYKIITVANMHNCRQTNTNTMWVMYPNGVTVYTNNEILGVIHTDNILIQCKLYVIYKQQSVCLISL